MLPTRLTDQANAASTTAHHLYILPPCLLRSRECAKEFPFWSNCAYLSALQTLPTRKASSSQSARFRRTPRLVVWLTVLSLESAQAGGKSQSENFLPYRLSVDLCAFPSGLIAALRCSCSCSCYCKLHCACDARGIFLLCVCLHHFLVCDRSPNEPRTLRPQNGLYLLLFACGLCTPKVSFMAKAESISSSSINKACSCTRHGECFSRQRT